MKTMVEPLSHPSHRKGSSYLVTLVIIVTPVISIILWFFDFFNFLFFIV